MKSITVNSNIDRNIAYSIILFTIGVLSFATNWYIPLTFLLLSILIIMLLDNLGKSIVLREVTAVFYVFTCGFMPWVGYTYYTADNKLARIWVKSMPVSLDTYYSFILPALCVFCFALTLPISKSKLDTGKSLQERLTQIKNVLKLNNKAGIYLIIIGAISTLFVDRLPTEFQFIASLLFFSSFTGLLYIYFSPTFKYKKIILFFFLAFVIVNALNSGMFTVVAYMGITIFSFFYFGKKTRLLKKIFFVCVGVVFFISLQNSKLAYRKVTWHSNYGGNKALLFGELMIDNFQHVDQLFDPATFFPFYVRANQGFNIALVIRRIPALVPYDEGANLAVSLAASLVPRVLWPNKPRSGGVANMRYYTGITIKGWSTNVGPLGEAYGSFGPEGAILFMLCLGLFIRFAYSRIFVLSTRIPLIILWIPVVFYQVTYSAENDTLQILNSVLKSALFIFILYKIVPSLFKGTDKYELTAQNRIDQQPLKTVINS